MRFSETAKEASSNGNNFEFPWLIQCAMSLGDLGLEDELYQWQPALCLLNISTSQTEALVHATYPNNKDPYFQCAILDEIFFHYNVWKSPETLAKEAIAKGNKFSSAVNLYFAKSNFIDITPQDKVILENDIRTAIFFKRLRNSLKIDLYDFERLRMTLMIAKLASDEVPPHKYLDGSARIMFLPCRIRSLINFREKHITYMGFEPTYIYWICK
jgi:hypothetical protein